MFASRACRTSVMVGTALSKADMRRLVSFYHSFFISYCLLGLSLHLALERS